MLLLCLIYGILNTVAIGNSKKLICGNTLFTGDIQSNIGPKFIDKAAYFTGISCNYTIKSDSHGYSVLEWKQFDVDSDMPTCSKASVKVYIGCGKDERYLGPFCSRNAANPFTIYSADGCIRLLMTGQAGFNPFFEANYRVYGFNSKNSPFTRISGGNAYTLISASSVIASPNWPYSYLPYMDSSSNIRWYVEIPAADSVKFFVMSMQFNQHQGNTQDDYVQVKSGSVSFKLGYSGPSSLSYRYAKSFRVKFSRNAIEKVRYIGSGFVVGYIAYGRDKNALDRTTNIDRSKKKKDGGKMSIGILITIIGVSFVGFFFIMWFLLWTYKRFRNQIVITQTIANDLENEANDDNTPPAPSAPLLTASDPNQNANDEAIMNGGDDSVIGNRQPLDNPTLSLNGPPSYAQLRQGDGELPHPPSYDDVMTAES